MVGVRLDMSTYFRAVTGLLLLYAFDKVFEGLAKIKGSTETIKTVYYLGSFKVVLGIFGMKIVRKFACCVDEA